MSININTLDTIFYQQFFVELPNHIYLHENKKNYCSSLQGKTRTEILQLAAHRRLQIHFIFYRRLFFYTGTFIIAVVQYKFLE